MAPPDASATSRSEAMPREPWYVPETNGVGKTTMNVGAVTRAMRMIDWGMTYGAYPNTRL